ncbi:MAG: tRNA (guanosine(37)-N1)-methyltransferase TrmD [Planctomycetota bacterium]
MRIDVLTLFPEVCEPFFAASILGRAQASDLVTIRCHNIRDYAAGPHGAVDDRPFGGGPGMVLMCQPVFDAVEAVENEADAVSTRILLTPQGEPFRQSIAAELAACEYLVLLAGHYEGFDERIRLGLAPREVSIGDYVLSGGEAAAMVLVDAVVRLIPGVLGDPEGALDDSFSIMAGTTPDAGETWKGAGYLEYPQYTRPRTYRGMEAPEILLSGDHGRIRSWRLEEAKRRTARRRPDLMRASDAEGKGAAEGRVEETDKLESHDA